tara:strand:+ start:452 stop:820 length:369 start_codon:yes stop_codon:yes gene_type:complete
MIYRNIEKLVLDTPNNMELGEKIRELYWKEREENDRELDIWYVDKAAIANELELQKDADALLVDEDNNVIGTFFVEPALSSPLEKLVDGLLGIDESNTIDKRTTIKGSYKDELPPSDYQLDN